MARWDVIGKPFSTAEMASVIPQITQRFRLPSDREESLLQGLGIPVIFNGDPAFTALYAEIWSDQGGSPSQKIATIGTQWLKADLLTQYGNGLKFVGMQFTNPVGLRPGRYYHVALRASAYTGNAASHIAWKHAYFDPYYSTGITPESIDAARTALEVAFFCSELD